MPSFLQSTLPPLNELRGSYLLRFATTATDVESCQRLRYEVFNLELGEGLSTSVESELDVDRFDAPCDHLMVIDEATGRTIGTYRMQTWDTAVSAEGFYAAGEFDLSSIPEAYMQQAIELGRAAVAADYRDQAVLFLLWRGLIAYLRWNRKRFFFGCSSITSQDPEEGLRAHDWLKRENHMHPEFEVHPTAEYRCESAGYESLHEEYSLPKLFALYLRFGGKLCGPPAIDREFGTIDFLTWTDTQLISRKFMALFSRGLPERE